MDQSVANQMAQVVPALLLPNGEALAIPRRGLSVGRARENDVWIGEPDISRYHLRFEYKDGRPLVRDLNSANGTYINGIQIAGAYALKDGDRIEIGRSVLVFRLLQAARLAPRPPATPPSPEGPSPDVTSPPAPPAPEAAAAPAAAAAHASVVGPAAPSMLDQIAYRGGDVGVSPMTGGSVDQGPPSEITRHSTLNLPTGRSAIELTPVGTLNIETAEAFRHLIGELLTGEQMRFLVDLGQVDYIDSTGLGALLQLYREASNRDGRVWFYNATPAVRSIIELTNLHKMLNLDYTRETAIAEAQQR